MQVIHFKTSFACFFGKSCYTVYITKGGASDAQGPDKPYNQRYA